MVTAKTQQNSLIPIADIQIGDEIQPCVDARTLHQWLKNGDHFATWIKRRIRTYGFIENEDFILISAETEIKKGRGGNRKSVDYLLTLDVAKELSMVENNVQGRIARRYFINCEKVLRQSTLSLFNQFNKAVLELENLSDIASNAGRTLCLVGKRYKPIARHKVEELQSQLQPLLI